MNEAPGLLLKRGSFTLTLGAGAACCSPVFLGGNFGRLFDAARLDPLAFHATFAFYAWLVVMSAGGWWFWQGLRAQRSCIDPWNPLAALGAGGTAFLCAVALWNGWFLPAADWGLWLNLASRCLWVALLGRAGAALWLAVRARVYEPASAPTPPDGGQEAELAECRDVIAEYLERDQRNQAALEDLRTILAPEAVRRAVLQAVHPDKARSERDRRAYTEIFQTANRIFSELAKG